MANIITTRRKPVKVDGHVNTLVIKLKGGELIELPIDADENKKMLQIEAAKYGALLGDFETSLKPKIKGCELTPLNMKQLGECHEIYQRLALGAWGTGELDTTPKNKGDDLSELIRESVQAGQQLQKLEEKMKGKNTPIEAEVTDDE